MNYRRNEDKWPVRETQAYNAVLDVETVDVGTEPVTLAEAKAHLRITFSDNDAAINVLITAARKSAEKFTGLSLLTKTVTAILNNGVGGIELPYGPVVSVSSVLNESGEALSSSEYEVKGTLFKTLSYPEYDYVKVIYTAGYSTCPADIKQAILFEVEAMIRTQENEKADGIKELARKLLQPHRRTSTWLP